MPAWDPCVGEIWFSIGNPIGRSACLVVLTRDERGIEIGCYRRHGETLSRTWVHGFDALQSFLRGHRYVPLRPGIPREVINFLEELASEPTPWTLQGLINRDPLRPPPRDVWDHLLED